MNSALMGDFNLPDTCWKDNGSGCKRSQRCLRSFMDNFMVEVLDGPAGARTAG